MWIKGIYGFHHCQNLLQTQWNMHTNQQYCKGREMVAAARRVFLRGVDEKAASRAPASSTAWTRETSRDINTCGSLALNQLNLASVHSPFLAKSQNAQEAEKFTWKQRSNLNHLFEFIVGNIKVNFYFWNVDWKKCIFSERVTVLWSYYGWLPTYSYLPFFFCWQILAAFDHFVFVKEIKIYVWVHTYSYGVDVSDGKLNVLI